MKRILLVLAVAAVTAGPALAAETYKGKGNGYGWKKNNGGVFPGGGNDDCGALCNPA
jgi:hypothetical protein